MPIKYHRPLNRANNCEIEREDLRAKPSETGSTKNGKSIEKNG